MLNQVKVDCFLSLAKTLSFTETSRELYITQQAVSNNISALEKDLGFPLFTRTSRAVSLTEEGKRCLEMFQKMQALYHATINELKQSRQQARFTLRIGYQEWLDFGSEPSRAMAALQKEYPSFRLSGKRFPPSILRDKILGGQLDLALMYKSFFQSLSLPDKELCSLDLMDTTEPSW